MLNGWSVPPLLLASINAYVAVHYLVIYLRTRRSREPLTFAHLALFVALYDVCCAFLYNVDTPAAGRPWQLGQFAAITCGAVALLLFVADYTGRPAGRLAKLVGAAYVLAWLAVLVGGTEILVTDVPLVRTIHLPFDLTVVYHEVEPGPLAAVHYAIALAVFAYTFGAGSRLYGSGKRRRAVRLMVAMSVFFVAAVNDTALGLGLIGSVYVMEYAFMGMIVLMADSLSSELVEAVRVQEALATSERSYHEVFNATGDAIIVHDAASGAILDVNQTMLELYGVRREDASRLSLADLSADRPPFTQAEARTRIRKAIQDGPQVFEWLARRRDGEEFWVEVALRASRIGGEDRVLAVVRDIGERKRAEETIRRSLRELEVLNAVSQAAVAAEDEAELIARTTEVVRGALFPDDCGVLLLDEKAGALQYAESYARRKHRPAILLGTGITGTVAATGETLRVDDVTTDARYLARAPEMRSELCVPLKLGARVIGVFNAESRRVAAFSASDEHVLATVAGQLATAIGRLRAAAAHRESEERFRRLAESAFEGIGIHDDGRIIDLNSRLAEMLGYEVSEVLGRHVIDFVAPESKVQVAGFMEAGTDEAYEHLAVRKDGWVFPIETQGKPLPGGGGRVRVAAVRDITERKRAEQRIRRQLDRLAALRAIDSAITGGRDLETVMGVVLDQVVAQLQVDAALVLRFDPAKHLLVPVACRGFRFDALAHVPVESGACKAARAAITRTLVTASDLGADPDHCSICQNLVEEGLRASFSAPLVAKDRVYGVLEVFCRAPQDVDAEWTDYLETLAGQLAIAIDNRSLLEDLERSNADLARAYDTTLEGWSRALELRDRETQGHTARVTELTLAVARTLGIGESDLVTVRRGVLLHDIGKMGIPDSILLKPGPLSPEEWVVMRRHPQLAHDLLHPIEFLRPALEIPFCHHEWWDGSGYPRGLKGEAIPLAARIFAVVDSWDGLCVARPYREAWPPERVRAHIRGEAGTHFDPRVVEVFLRLVG